MVPLVCRDCLKETPPRTPDARGAPPACPACGSPRLVSHPELDQLAIAHIDCDAFFAAVEKRDNPALRDKPVIVGGTGGRGVVSTACYIARIHGVRSAMPMFQARKLCPEAVVLPPDMARYKAVSRQLRAKMEALTPLVEPLSIDEAFLDLTGTERLHGASPARVLMRLAREVEAELGITISVGLSYNKFLAKLASDMDKPRGFSVIGRADARDVLAPLPVSRIWGVGLATQARLARHGIRLIRDIQTLPLDQLLRAAGEDGMRLRRLALGEDNRPVTPSRERKSLSSETTLATDVSDRAVLERHLREAADTVARQLRAEKLAAASVVVKLKTAAFQTITRSRRLARPTQTARDLLDIALPLLATEADGRRFRLVGLGVTLCPPPEEAPDLGFDFGAPADDRRLKLESALDQVRARFGGKVIGLSTPAPRDPAGRKPERRG
ncbi:DNA polymerase IV [Pedomonas sp. V897]|uniref:DNA polymerase IV n=1 Tax=Pedomonas sp. V897 TaxID=3446482 RepID=UPI003EE325CC